MKMLIDALHAGRTVVALSYHFHLYLCILDAVASADHGAKYAVAREIGVAGHEQVAQVDGVVDDAFDRVDGAEETVHLLHGIGDQDALEVVAIFQTVADAGCDGVDVFQD